MLFIYIFAINFMLYLYIIYIIYYTYILYIYIKLYCSTALNIIALYTIDQTKN